MFDEQSLIATLIARVLFLETQLDQSVFHEAAMIGTLRELLPGFAPRYDQLRKAAERTASPRNPEELAELQKALEDWKRSRH